MGQGPFSYVTPNFLFTANHIIMSSIKNKIPWSQFKGTLFGNVCAIKYPGSLRFNLKLLVTLVNNI